MLGGHGQSSRPFNFRLPSQTSTGKVDFNFGEHGKIVDFDALCPLVFLVKTVGMLKFELTPPQINSNVRHYSETCKMKYNLEGKIFRSTKNTANGEAGAETIFHYHQVDDVVWAEYAGGNNHKKTLDR